MTLNTNSTNGLEFLTAEQFTKTIIGQIILRGINAKQFFFDEPAGKKCSTCGMSSPAIFFEWKNKKYWVEPVECNACREKAYEEYLTDQKREKYQRGRLKCGGYANLLNKDHNDFVFYEDLKEKENQMQPLNHVSNFLSGQINKGAFFYGGVGTGKSYLLKVLANELTKQYRNVCYIGSSELVNLLRSACSKDAEIPLSKLIKDFQFIDVLIIDDIGTEQESSFVIEKYFQILNFRWDKVLPTFFSSNMTIDDIKTNFDRRLGSRLGDKKWISYYNFGGNDYRKAINLDEIDF